MIDRQYMRDDNTAHDELERLGHKPQGATDDFKLVCVYTKDDDLVCCESYRGILNKLNPYNEP